MIALHQGPAVQGTCVTMRYLAAGCVLPRPFAARHARQLPARDYEVTLLSVASVQSSALLLSGTQRPETIAKC